MSATKWAKPYIFVAKQPDWELEDAIAVGISIVPLDQRDFKVICGELAILKLTNEQRLFLMRLAVAPDARQEADG